MSAIRELLGAPEAAFVSRVSRALGLTRVAEEEIAAAMRKGRRGRVRVWNSFGLLCPTANMVDLDDAVYRHHVRELLDRVAREEDTRPGTRAEVLCAISGATLASRLDRDVELLALTIADEVFPGRDLVGDYGKSSHPGALEEKLAWVRRQCAVEGRVMPEELRPVPKHALAELR